MLFTCIQNFSVQGLIKHELTKTVIMNLKEYDTLHWHQWLVEHYEKKVETFKIDEYGFWLRCQMMNIDLFIDHAKENFVLSYKVVSGYC